MTTPIEKLAHYLSQLPGIGEKTAMRLTFFILKKDPEFAKKFSLALSELHAQIRFCEKCQNLTQMNPCLICANPKRKAHTLLVVETPQDMMAIERSGSYQGLYHILHGAISPLDGVRPDDLKIPELLSRLHSSEVTEVILATSSNVEGDATALYLMKLLKGPGLKITRLATGIPVGSDIEYLDPLTLQRALMGRCEMTSYDTP